MLINLADIEASIILGAALMYWGLPFHFAQKRNLTERETRTLDDISERLVAYRENLRLGANDTIPGVAFSRVELDLILEVLGACLKECDENPVDLSFHLGTRNKNDVQSLLERLCAAK